MIMKLREWRVNEKLLNFPPVSTQVTTSIIIIISHFNNISAESFFAFCVFDLQKDDDEMRRA